MPLRQLQHPLAFAAGANNRVIEWRLFFPSPAMGWGFRRGYTSRCRISGCLLVLFSIARLLLRHGFPACQAFAATTLAATCSWFFVSTGWLAYFDSWYVLGLLITVFAPPGEMLAAIVVTPWIDERFVLTLPLCPVLRDRTLAATGSPRSGRERWREAAGCAAALLPWVLVRLGAYLAHRDAVSGAYVREMTPGANWPFYPRGLWYGLRWGWAAVIAWLALEWRARVGGSSPGWSLPLGLTLAVNLLAANDLSRSVSTVVPVMVPRPSPGPSPLSVAVALAAGLRPAASVSSFRRSTPYPIGPRISTRSRWNGARASRRPLPTTPITKPRSRGLVLVSAGRCPRPWPAPTGRFSCIPISPEAFYNRAVIRRPVAISRAPRPT